MDSQDPFNGVVYGEVYAGNGTFVIRIGWFSNSLGYNVYTFRWQDNDFYLIGYDPSELNRVSLEVTTYSYNFLTWRQNIITESANDENSDKTKKIGLEAPA
ncbi:MULTISPECIES: hypothetical protein [Bartonella]|uniref:hypothetical protein n=1 Tax=Bartonella TaxID=773 RepID=UPI0018DD404A|nr:MULTISPECIES: hypothetical protein [Bartonella]MBH9976318.1 hypothetical protein [Bartonella choladocola]MBI0015818.1 hypothetical protein [Bartonella sp. B10834G3]